MPTITLRGNCSGLIYKYNTGTKVHHGWSHPKYIEILANGDDPYLRWLTRTDSETLNGTELWRREMSINKDTGAATITWPQVPQVWRDDCIGGGLIFANWPRNPATEGELNWQVSELFRTNSVTAYTYYGDEASQLAFLQNSSLAMAGGSFYANPSNTWEEWTYDTESRVDLYAQVTYCTDLDQTWRYRRNYTNQYTYTQLRADCEAAMAWDTEWSDHSTSPISHALNQFEPDSNDWPNDAKEMQIREILVRILGTEYCLITLRIYYPSGYFEADIIACETTGVLTECSTEACGPFNLNEFTVTAPDWELGGYDEGSGNYFIHNYAIYFSIGCTECPQMTAASATITADDASITADNYREFPPTPP